MEKINSQFLVITHFLFMGILFSCNSPAKNKSPSALNPNIILINVDDLSPNTISPYGQKTISTPRLQKMAEEGTLFTKGYSSATSCAPSRIALFLGKHLGHIDRKDNTNEDRILSEDLCFSEVLRDNGYRTAMYGKLHGAHFRNWFDIYTQVVDDTPYDHGFDHFVGFLGAMEAHQMYLDGVTHPEENNPKHLWEENNGHISKKKIAPDRYTQNEFMDQALNFITETQKQSFFLYLSFQIPHFEQVVPKKGDKDYYKEDEGLLEQYLDTITNKSIFPETPYMGTVPANQRINLEPLATYAALISRLDRDVGKIMDLLNDLHLKENTVVIFTADNGFGGWPARDIFQSTGSLRASKGSLYEGGIRVPFIFWGKDIRSNITVDEPIVQYDLGATILDLANIQPNFGDGISWKSTLSQGVIPKRSYVYWENFITKMRQAILIDGRYKIIKIESEKNLYQYEVYDLSNDESEKNNLASTDMGQDLIEEAAKIFEKEHIPSKNYTINF